MTKERNSIIDSLFPNEDIENVDDELDYIPKKCRHCNNAMICNVLPAAIGFYRAGIKISIDTCPFYVRFKDVE